MNKKAQELAMHDKDTGSSEIQIALLTEKIETLSKHIKQFKKDKHSSVGLLRAVNRRKKLLEYLKKYKNGFLQKCTVEIGIKKIKIKIDRTEWNETNETKWK
jgi:small subunit ribosomal protein S15